MPHFFNSSVLLMYLFLAMLGHGCHAGSSLVVERGLLSSGSAWASRCGAALVEPGLRGVQTSAVVPCGLGIGLHIKAL